MTDPEFWRRAEAKFRRLQPLPPQPGEVHHDSHNGLCAHWRGGKNPEGLPPWYFSNAGGGTKKLFRRTAERAAVELGRQGGPTGVFFWLDLLRLDGLFYEPQGDRGYIYQVCNASAEYCLKCETEAKAAANATGPAGASEPPTWATSQVQEVFGPIDEVISAIRQAEQADPDLRRQREKVARDYQSMHRRRLGMPLGKVEQQENLLRGCRDHALTSLDRAVRDLQLHFPALEADIKAACDEIRDGIVLSEWDRFLQQYKSPSDCKLEFGEFKSALWTERALWSEGEGSFSLEDRANAAVRKLAAGLTFGRASDTATVRRPDGAGNAEANGTLPSRHEIEKFVKQRFDVASEDILAEYAARKNSVLSQVQSTHNSGGYLPALTNWGADRLRKMILAHADAYVEAFTLHGVPSDVRAEQDLQTVGQQMAAGTISGIRGELELMEKSTGKLRGNRVGHLNREIHAAMTSAVKKGVLRLRQQRIKSRYSESALQRVQDNASALARIGAQGPAGTTEQASKASEGAVGPEQVLTNTKRRGRRPNHERRECIRTVITAHGDGWRDHLSDIFKELDSKDLSVGSFQQMKIDVGDGVKTQVSKWEDLDLAVGVQRKKIIDTLRKYVL